MMKSLLFVAVIAASALLVLAETDKEVFERNSADPEAPYERAEYNHLSELAKTSSDPAQEILRFLLPNSRGAADLCQAHGEFRRKHGCVSVKHTKKDACCWQSVDGKHGLLPYDCCGSAWDEARCGNLIDWVCEINHPQDN